MGAKYNVTFTEKEKRAFELMNNFGMPMANLKSYLAMSPEQRKKVTQTGIPYDSLKNELGDWVLQTRLTNPDVVVAVKGDVSTTLPKDQKVLAIQKEIEETTALELPMLEKNLVIISTIASIATLVGLIGTVLGMIKAFSALSAGGAPDAVGLANGISEALINTALGITGSAIAIIAYNFFTSKIDELTYSIDEAGFSIIQTFASQEGNTVKAPYNA